MKRKNTKRTRRSSNKATVTKSTSKYKFRERAIVIESSSSDSENTGSESGSEFEPDKSSDVDEPKKSSDEPENNSGDQTESISDSEDEINSPGSSVTNAPHNKRNTPRIQESPSPPTPDSSRGNSPKPLSRPQSPSSSRSSFASSPENSLLLNKTPIQKQSIQNVTPILNVKKLQTTIVEKQPSNHSEGKGATINAVKIKEHLVIYYNERPICDSFAKKEGLEMHQMKILWNNYLEFMSIKVIGCDTGLNGLIRYSTCPEMHELWHNHVLSSNQYRQFMDLINNVNPLIDYLDPSLEHASSTEETKKEQIKNTIEAYGKLFNKECSWLTLQEEGEEDIDLELEEVPDTKSPSKLSLSNNHSHPTPNASSSSNRSKSSIKGRTNLIKNSNPPTNISSRSRKCKQLKSPDSETLTVNIKTLATGKSLTFFEQFTITPSMTVRNLKEMLSQRQKKVPIESSLLCFNGKHMENDKSLSEYDVVDLCTIHYVESRTSRRNKK